MTNHKIPLRTDVAGKTRELVDAGLRLLLGLALLLDLARLGGHHLGVADGAHQSRRSLREGHNLLGHRLYPVVRIILRS